MSIRTTTVRNISYIGASQLIILVLTVINVIVLARILKPEDFGIVGIGLVFLALFTVIQDFGITPAVIQRDTRIEDAISVGLTLRWIIAFVLMLVVVCISPLVSSFYGETAIALVLVVMSLNLFVQPFSFSSSVLLTRALDFSSLAIAGIAQALTGACVSIGLALANFSYWSIVFGSLSGGVSYVMVLRYFERTSFTPKIDLSLMKELLGFGVHLLVVGLMAFIILNVDQLVVGKVLGVTMLGTYFIAARFGRAWGDQMASTINKVLFPTMARMRDSIEQLMVAQVQTLRMIAIAAVPLSVTLSALSPMFVSVVLGSDWAVASVPIAILSFQGLWNSLISPSWNVLISIGRPKYLSIQATTQAVILVVGLYPAAHFYGINGVCVLTTSLSFCVLIYFLLVFSSLFNTKMYNIIGPALPSFFSGAVTYVVLALFRILAPTNSMSLAALASFGIVIYIASLHVVSRGRDVRDFVHLVRDAILD